MELHSETDNFRIENICKSYNKTIILHDISLKLLRGEVVGLFGPNGAGLMKPDKELGLGSVIFLKNHQFFAVFPFQIILE
ncbi:unnamed protein product [Oppiella nova]|uniref:ABC transporter domain-containing protein n=1 Tax=Oppiella nova TaxID=334625 RepID=A0A7R9QAZ5_9ACAR|nr:unnamed protein product [Oppiella nova]CAG2161602.1 unnamed protein product [Oppiella nova]